MELFDGSEPARVRHLFGLRGPDPMQAAAGILGVELPQLAWVRQVHGNSVRVVEGLPAEGGEHDALITGQSGVALCIRTADCLPILIRDDRRGVIGAVHAGWRGSMRRVAATTVEAMGTRFGSLPRDIIAALGPAAGSCCYEVDRPVLSLLRSEFPYWEALIRSRGSDKAMLDLAEWNARQLLDVGLQADRIIRSGVCTICHPEGLYSYRRDGHSKGGMVSAILKVESS